MSIEPTQPQTPPNYQFQDPAVGNSSSASNSGSVGNVSEPRVSWQIMMQQVLADRAQILEEQLIAQIEEISARNDQMAALNQVSAELGILLAGVGTKADAQINDPTAYNQQIQVLQDMGYEVDFFTSATTRSEVEALMTQIRTWSDSLSTENQMDMIRMQSLQDRYNETISLMSQILSGVAGVNSKVINNM